MQYYYDINLHFDDAYINCYEWGEYEHFNRLPIYKVDSIKEFLEYNIKIESEYKNILISDGITSLGLEIVNNNVAYISSIPYEDEFKINKLAMESLEELKYQLLEKKNIKYRSAIDKRKEKFLTLLDKEDKDFIKFLYYEITGKESNDFNMMKKYLVNDIRTNFSNQYYQLYDMIMIGD